VGVAQVVESDDGHGSASYDPVEDLAERVWVHGFPRGGGEHPAGSLDADRRVLGGLHGSPCGEHREGGVVEGDAAVGVAGLAA
jgi:hypothetical protein